MRAIGAAIIFALTLALLGMAQDTKSPDLKQQRNSDNLPSKQANAPGVNTGQGDPAGSHHHAKRHRTRGSKNAGQNGGTTTSTSPH